MEDKSRVKGDSVLIDNGDVSCFFKNRIKKELPHIYNLVNYQDDNPELVLKRDKLEKEKVGKFFKISPDDYVLDIGCGVGRWGDAVIPTLEEGKYVGVDYTEEFVKIVAQRFMPYKRNSAFITGSFQELSETLIKNKEDHKYTKIIINGVLMYINDKDIKKCLGSLNDFMDESVEIYIKESVGIKERLTLRNYYSNELTSTYNAIYRSLCEYNEFFTNILLPMGFTNIICGPTWDDGIDYSKETSNWFWIFKRF